MATSYGSTDVRPVNSPIQYQPVASQTPENNGHVHDIACLLIIVVQVALYLLLNIFSFIKSPTFNTAGHIEAVHVCAVVIYCLSCVAMVILLVRCVYAYRMNRARNGLTTAHSNEDESSRGSMCIRHFVLTFLFLGNVIQIIWFSVLSKDSDSTSKLLVAFKILFCIFELPLVIYCNRRRLFTGRFNLYLLAFIIAGNACVCVDFVSFAIRSQEYGEELELYEFSVHFVVFSMFMLFNMTASTSDEAASSVNISQDEVRNMEPSRSEPTVPMRDTWFRKMKHYITATIRFICYYSLYFSLLYSAFHLSINIARKVHLSRGGWNDTDEHGHNVSSSDHILSIYDAVETGDGYIYSIVTFVVFIFAGLENSVARIKSADKVMLLVGLSAVIVIQVVETVIYGNYLFNLSSPRPTAGSADFILAVVFSNLALFCQPVFILIVTGLRPMSPLTLREMFIRGTVVFLCVFNFKKWIQDNFFFPKDHSVYNGTAETVKALYGFTAPFYTINSFYRLFSAVLLYEVLLFYPRE